MTETKSILKCIGIVTIPILVLAVAMMASSFHVVEEGHVGIYFKQGALQVIENWLLVRGHSTTTWTKFYPILTPSLLEWTISDILHDTYPLSRDQVSTDPLSLFLST
jgi:hypothetical protein